MESIVSKTRYILPITISLLHCKNAGFLHTNLQTPKFITLNRATSELHSSHNAEPYKHQYQALNLGMQTVNLEHHCKIDIA
jgi:hypothetical protein